MLVQLTEDEGATSDRPSEPQPTPSPPPQSAMTILSLSRSQSPRRLPLSSLFLDSIPEVSGGNHGGQSSSDKSLSGNEGDMTLQSVYDLCISLCTQVTDQAKEIKHLKAQIKKLKKQSKPVITHHRSWMKSVSLKKRLARKKTLKANWMQKESVSKQGRKSAKAEPSVHANPLFDELPDDTMDYIDTEDAQDMGRTREVVNAEKEGNEDAVSTEDVVSTDKEKVSTDRSKVSTDRSKDSTDKEEEGTDRSRDSTDKEKEGNDMDKDSTVSLDEGSSNNEPSKAFQKVKEKGVELKDVEETERPRPTLTRSLLTLKPLPTIDLKDKGKKKIEEEDESDTGSEDIPEAKKKTQREERELFTCREREKFLHDTIAAQRRFLAEQRAIAIRNKPPTRTQLRNQMMTYLKHVGNKKHSNLKSKTFKEIQALYEKVKRFDESFTAVGSTEDEKRIKEMNEGVKDTDQKKLKEEDTAKVPAKVEVIEQGTKKRKGGYYQNDCKENEIMEKKLFIARLNKVSLPDGDYLVIYRANGNFRAFNYLMEIMMESSTEENDQSDFWSNQQDWKDLSLGGV
ncbi:hypothetical protein Tco_0826260 [Tanacetum coccineum]